MKIAKFKVPLELAQTVHLKEIDLTNKPLGSTIALIGKNGAGKSRILNFVGSYFRNLTPDQILDGHITNVPSVILNRVNQLVSGVATWISKPPKYDSNSLNDNGQLYI
ncbi:MAG TPA: hypothetical protein VF622_11400 [Segetibacter sp.]|jgi:ABC-type cobalamin/Fe3+-siderophores transport system ATPase subunit